MNKKVVMLFILGIFLVSFIDVVHASIPTPSEALGNAFDAITKLFGVKWDDKEKFVGFMRFLFFVLAFTLFYLGAYTLFKKKNIAIVIGAIFGLISTLFVPKEIIIAIVTTYSTLFSVLLLGLPIVAVLYLVIYVIPNDSRFWYFLKFAICGLTYFVLLQIIDSVKGLDLMLPGIF